MPAMSFTRCRAVRLSFGRIFFGTAAAAFAASCLFCSGSLGGTPLRSAFVMPSSAHGRSVMPSRTARIAMQAGSLLGEDAGSPASVFAGPFGQENKFWKTFNKTRYVVFRSNGTFCTVRTKERGLWNFQFNMPEESFKRLEGWFQRRYRIMKRKLREKHGNGRKLPNGIPYYLHILHGNYWAKQKYGQKYLKEGPEGWIRYPQELEQRARLARAKELKRLLELQAEHVRVNKMRDLGVWLGEESWRKPWMVKVDYVQKGPNAVEVKRGMTKKEAAALAAEEMLKDGKTKL